MSTLVDIAHAYTQPASSNRASKQLALLLSGVIIDAHEHGVGLQVASPFEKQTAASRDAEQASAGIGYMVQYQQHAGFVQRNAPMLRAIPRFCELTSLGAAMCTCA